MIRSHAKLLGLAACLAWAVLPLGAQQPPKVELLTAHRMGKTPPMRAYLATHHVVPNAPYRVFPLRKASHPGHGGGGSGGGGSTGWTDPVLQSSEGSTQIGAPVAHFQGMGSVGYVPPDTNMSVGPNDVVETVNVDWEVYDKSGNTLLGPAPIHSIFQAALGGNLASGDACASIDGGDPIVLYDAIDQKWIISQLAYNSSFSSNEYCLAISATSDPTGSYYAYDLPFGSNLPDYPKLAIWANGASGNPSSWTGVGGSSYAGVYFSANIFSRGSSFTGAVMCGFPLSQVATPPSSLNWVCAYNGTSVYSILPADLQGSPISSNGTTWPAPPATAEYYMQFSGSNTLNLFSFAPNFTNGTAAVYNVANIPVQTFYEACGGGSCVPQLNTTNQLDSLGDRLMYRLSYRNDGTNQYMVVNQSVQDSSASTQTGVRWYQLTEPTSPSSGGGWGVAQQGTFGPSDGVYRWMGSIAQDQYGDLGVGFSASSPSIFPGIGYTGRTPIDPTGSLEGEQLLNIGAGAQTSVNRWGDYSSMSIDPVDDCTFWYANEYLKSTGSYTNWGTYILSFKFPACGGTVAPGFSVLATPSSQTVTAGSGTGANYTVSVASVGGFSNDVTLGVTGLPSGTSYSFTPGSVTGGSGNSTFSVSADSTTVAGSYPLQITGTGGGLSSTAYVTLVVNGTSSGGFSLSTSSSSLSLSAKSSASTTITVTSSGGFNGTVTLSVTGLPHGTSASFSPSSVTGSGTSNLTITAGGHPQTGTFTLTVTGTSGSLSAPTTVTLSVQ